MDSVFSCFGCEALWVVLYCGGEGASAANWESSVQKLLRGDKSLEAQCVIKSCGHQQWPMGKKVSVTESRGRCLAFLFGGLTRALGSVYVSVPPTPVKCPLSVQGTHIELGKVIFGISWNVKAWVLEGNVWGELPVTLKWKQNSSRFCGSTVRISYCNFGWAECCTCDSFPLY